MIPFIIAGQYYQCEDENCDNFKYTNSKINPSLIIFLAVFIVIVRGYMGYGIPTSWNKTMLQNVLLFVIMGIGKALGGVLSDAFGMKKIALISTSLAIPFLCFGDSIMIISLIGVMLFSMTMSITLAILVSVLNKKPGLSFGLTTIGLFLGTMPIFFVKITNEIINYAFIIVMSLVCTLIFNQILKKDNS